MVHHPHYSRSARLRSPRDYPLRHRDHDEPQLRGSTCSVSGPSNPMPLVNTHKRTPPRTTALLRAAVSWQRLSTMLRLNETGGAFPPLSLHAPFNPNQLIVRGLCKRGPPTSLERAAPAVRPQTFAKKARQNRRAKVTTVVTSLTYAHSLDQRKAEPNPVSMTPLAAALGVNCVWKMRKHRCPLTS